jgi:hypothetical protein
MIPTRVLLIVREIAGDHGVTAAEILGQRANVPVWSARRAAMARLHAAGFTTTQIAKWMGRDRGNVWRSIQLAGRQPRGLAA